MTTITAPTTTSDSFLRFALRLDAVVSAAVGVVSIALAPRIAEWSGTTTAFEYAVGAFFLVYGLAVFGLSRTPTVRPWGIAIAVGNLVFSVATVVLVVAGVMPLTTTGIVLVLGSGVFTLVMADLQYIGLRRMRA